MEFGCIEGGLGEGLDDCALRDRHTPPAVTIGVEKLFVDLGHPGGQPGCQQQERQGIRDERRRRENVAGCLGHDLLLQHLHDRRMRPFAGGCHRVSPYTDPEKP